MADTPGKIEPGKIFQSALPQLLLAAIIWISGAKFFIEPAGSESWKTLGIWIPALWLAGLGPDRLLQRRKTKTPAGTVVETASRRRAIIGAVLAIAVGIAFGAVMETLVKKDREEKGEAAKLKIQAEKKEAPKTIPPDKPDPEPDSLWARILLTLSCAGIATGGGIFVFLAMKVDGKNEGG